jgi:hypothetical protein
MVDSVQAVIAHPNVSRGITTPSDTKPSASADPSVFAPKCSAVRPGPLPADPNIEPSNKDSMQFITVT